VAIKGLGHDGRDYIDAAKRAGAVAVLLEAPDAPVGPRLLYEGKTGFRQLVTRLAQAVYQNPDRQLELVGVTGTNGKSSICYLLEAILLAQGQKAGVMGTINYRWPGQIRTAPNTTPEGPLLFQTLADMARDKCQSVVMEVSSHALDLGRVAGLEFSWALFTNLTQDHLDFHDNIANYFQAKKRLFFERLKKDGAVRAVVGVDDAHGRELRTELGSRAYGYGFSADAEIRGEIIRRDLNGLTLLIHSPFGEWEQTSPLIGSYNALNILGTVGLAGLMGVPVPMIQKALATAKGAPGRLEAVASPPETLVLVDYAHSPGALETVLKALRQLKPNRLLAIFGCGGDRDRLKRPLMGEAVARGADLAILTSDNPRTEEPLAIIAEARVGLSRLNVPLLTEKEAAMSQRGYLVEPDRRKAINLAASILQRGDILLIAGKGHEDYQIINREKWPFDDRLVARQALELAFSQSAGQKGAECP
jgi:UDP-N-acetylmuramoyl-L-alanyl-D-glutamate--2,6-diaminopimelate ligase